MFGRAGTGVAAGGGEAAGARFGCGEATARWVVDSGVGVNDAGVGAGEGDDISISFPFLDLDFSLTVLVGFSGRATWFLLQGKGEGVCSLRINFWIFPSRVARSAMWRLCLSWGAPFLLKPSSMSAATVLTWLVRVDTAQHVVDVCEAVVGCLCPDGVFRGGVSCWGHEEHRGGVVLPLRGEPFQLF